MYPLYPTLNISLEHELEGRQWVLPLSPPPTPPSWDPQQISWRWGGGDIMLIPIISPLWDLMRVGWGSDNGDPHCLSLLPHPHEFPIMDLMSVRWGGDNGGYQCLPPTWPHEKPLSHGGRVGENNDNNTSPFSTPTLAHEERSFPTTFSWKPIVSWGFGGRTTKLNHHYFLPPTIS